MDIELVKLLLNLGGLGLFAYFTLVEIRETRGELLEQRREARRARAEDQELLWDIKLLVVTLLERVSPGDAVPTPMPHIQTGPVQPRTKRHHAPAFGVEITKPERPSRRMRSVSDPPDEPDDAR